MKGRHPLNGGTESIVLKDFQWGTVSPKFLNEQGNVQMPLLKIRAYTEVKEEYCQATSGCQDLIFQSHKRWGIRNFKRKDRIDNMTNKKPPKNKNTKTQKATCPAPAASTAGPCPTLCQSSRTPPNHHHRHWKLPSTISRPNQMICNLLNLDLACIMHGSRKQTADKLITQWAKIYIPEVNLLCILTHDEKFSNTWCRYTFTLGQTQAYIYALCKYTHICICIHMHKIHT